MSVSTVSLVWFQARKKLHTYNFSMAYSRFANAFSRISKNYDFRFQVCCHIDLVIPYFVFVAGVGVRGGWSIWYFIHLHCTHSEVKFKGNNVQTMQIFVLVIKNNEAVLVIKWSTAQQNQQHDLCTKRRLGSAWGIRPVFQSLCCPTQGSLGH